MNGFDFDKTIYKKDSSMEFYLYLIKKYPIYFYHIFLTGIAFVGYLLKIVKKHKAKEIMFSLFAKIKHIDNEVTLFWENRTLETWYLEIKKDDDMIISASPYFLVKGMCDKYNIRNLIATNVDKKNGLILGNNCYGVEKLNRFKKEYEGYLLSNFYSDSYSDIVMLELAQQFHLIKRQRVVKTITKD